MLLDSWLDWTLRHHPGWTSKWVSAHHHLTEVETCSLLNTTKACVYNIHCHIQQHSMESFGEMIPFAKEMLNQRPSRHMLKIYMLGSSLALLGLLGALVEALLLPFVEQRLVTESSGGKQQGWKSELAHPAVLDMHKPQGIKVASTLRPGGRRGSANRLHASWRRCVLSHRHTPDNIGSSINHQHVRLHFVTLKIYILTWLQGKILGGKVQDTGISGCWAAH